MPVNLKGLGVVWGCVDADVGEALVHDANAHCVKRRVCLQVQGDACVWGGAGDGDVEPVCVVGAHHATDRPFRG